MYIYKMTKKDIVEEIHRYARLNFTRRKYNMAGISNTIQVDLIEMQPFRHVNRGLRYILIAIDIFSKKAYAVGMKDKTAKTTVNAMEKIFDKIGERILNIHNDAGSEFMNNQMTRLLARSGGINQYITYSGKKASIVERLIRTIKRKIYMRFSLQGSYKWYNILDEIIDEYNNTW